ncbi:MAG: MopE-related protein [Sedimentisphaerales bacterium]
MSTKIFKISILIIILCLGKIAIAERIEESGEYSCIVNFYDFAVFANHWLESGTGLPADLDKNGTVDFNDLKLLTDFWLWPCPSNWPPRGPLCLVDFEKFNIFAEYWLQSGFGLPADLDHSEAVDFTDFKLFVDVWLSNCPDNWPLLMEMKTWYRDADKDGYGNPKISVQSITQPPGYVSDNTDCDDYNAGINPSEEEVCDGIDNNCNGMIDENTSYDINPCQTALCIYGYLIIMNKPNGTPCTSGGIPGSCQDGTCVPDK